MCWDLRHTNCGGKNLNIVFCEQVSDTDKETYQTQVNEAMARYKQEYNDWFESLSADEQKVQSNTP
jgi:hypothetical protein